MWNLRCKTLYEDKQGGLHFTKIDNEIRSHYQDKDLLLPIDSQLFQLPLARLLAQSISMKEAHLLGFKSAKLRLEAKHNPDNLENVINPENRRRKKKKTKTTTTLPTTNRLRRHSTT
jgi:hypothetical protein